MNTQFSVVIVLSGLVLISGCTAVPLSQQAFGRKFPVAQDAGGDQVALITFSADQKYETEKGVPLQGDPVICGRDGVFRINPDNVANNKVSVRAGEEIAVTSVVQWVNTGFRKTCWPFVAFAPESGSKYIVVNERIGGKGVSALWTGAAMQTCEVSVYRESPTGFQRIETHKPPVNLCGSNER